MNSKKISKSEILQLVTPVIDDEVSAEIRELFFDNIDAYHEIQQQYKSNRRVKELLQKRCPRAKSPPNFNARMRALTASLL